MTIARVNVTKVGGATGGTTPNANFLGANLIICINSFLGGAEPTISDNQSNPAFTQLALQSNGAGSGAQRISYLLNPIVSATQNFTLTGTVTSAIFVAYSGVLTASAFDQQNGAVDASGLPSSFQAGSITPGVNNELAVAGCMFSAAGEGSVTIGGGFSIVDFIARVGGGVNPGCYFAELIQTTAAAANPAWAFTQGPTVAATISSFKPSLGATATNRPSSFIIG